MTHRLAALLFLFVLIALDSSIRAEDKPQPPAPTTAPDHKSADKLSVTEGQVNAAGQTLKYKATAGQLVLKDEADKAKAEVFFVAYEKQPAPDSSQRPITFVFNGGPGAAAVWLHLGTAGPRRLALNDAGDAPAPPYRLEDNPNTWLTDTDLVFIDPVGTGYSRAAAGEKPEQFYGVHEDIRSVADFIRLYISRNQRWASPKFLAGESYGTTRAAGLSQHLLEQQGISLNGIVLISSVLNFGTIDFSGGNDLPYALYLPSYAAIAHHWKKLPPDLQNADVQKVLDEVEQWAMHDYLAALAAGSGLSSEARQKVVERLARYTSLSRDEIERGDLRIEPGTFRKLLLAKEREVIGRFDARVAGYNPDPLTLSADYDPSLAPYLAAYTATFNDYARRVLKFESDRSYDVLTGRVHPWNFGPAGNGFLDVAPSLQDAMMKSPKMRVMFANGSADLATPYTAARYTIRHLNLSESLRANITHHIYVGGHMLYHNRPSLQKLGDDVRAFIRDAAPTTRPATEVRIPESPKSE